MPYPARIAAALVALLASLAVTILVVGAGQSPGAVVTRILVVDRDGDEGRALRSESPRVLADYGSFVVAEAEGRAVDALVAAGADVRDDFASVALARGAQDPRARTQLDAARPTAGGAPRGLALVQFVGPIKGEWLAELEATGVKLVTYQAQNAQLVAGTATALKSVAALRGRSHVRAVVPVQAEDKVAPALAGAPATGRQRLEVATVAGTPGAAARSTLGSLSRPLRPAVTIDAITHQQVDADPGAVARLAALGGVVSVAPYQRPALRDERASTIVAGLLSPTFQPVFGTGHLAWLTAKGFGATPAHVVDITDEGVDKGIFPAPAGSHPDLYTKGSTTQPSRIAYSHNDTGDPDGRDCGGHGSNIAGIIASYNIGTGTTYEDTARFNYGVGIDPFVKIGASRVFTCTGGEGTASVTVMHRNAYAKGARISNNSWGIDNNGAYTALDREFDSMARDASTLAGNQGLVYSVAGGNTGPAPKTVGTPGTAKNVIVVGASENVRSGNGLACADDDVGANSARDVGGFSARGPTIDGRLKPDIVAPGSQMVGIAPQHPNYTGSGTFCKFFPAASTRYNVSSGTSQAAPVVAGASSLLRTWYLRTVSAVPPSPALTKAILVNTTTDLAGGQNGVPGGTVATVPNNVQGWGRVNVGTVLDGTRRVFRDEGTPLGATGGTSTRTYTIDSTTKPVRVTLAYSDAPGPTTGNAFVNDLDLEVSAGGQTYKGNVFAGGRSVVGGAADPRNNLESVWLPAGVAGALTVKVIGRSIGGNGVPGNADVTDQDFAVAISNAKADAPVLAHGTTAVAPQGDGDATVEPGETFRLTETVRNTGPTAATGVQGALASKTTGLTVAPATVNYPDVPAGGTATPGTPFTGTVAGTVPCGTTLSLGLTITSAQGSSVAIPLTVKTGAPGAPFDRAATGLPLAIADGVEIDSPLGVTVTGILADVNVTITSITHTSVGDLRLTIVHPDGTAVVLAESPGTIDNTGDNLRGTVFDDEAARAIGATGTAAPYTGSFKPQRDQLSRLDGKASAGTWILRVADLADGDTGRLDAWGLRNTTFACG